MCDFGQSSFIAVLFFDRYFVNKHLCLEPCDMFVIVFYHIITHSVVCNLSMKGYITFRESSEWKQLLMGRVETVDDLRDWISQRNIPAYETLYILKVAKIVLLCKINNISSHKTWIAFTAPYQIKTNLIRDPFLGTRPFVGTPVADFNAVHLFEAGFFSKRTRDGRHNSW